MTMGTSRSRLIQVQKLVEKDVNSQVLYDRERAQLHQQHNEELARLKSQLHEVKDELCSKDKCMSLESRKLQEEHRKNLSLLFCNLPLQLVSGPQSYSELSHSYAMVTLAQCDVIAFATLSCLLKPREAVALIDHIQAIIDEAFQDKNIFIMERYSDGCIAVSGLVDQNPTSCPKSLSSASPPGSNTTISALDNPASYAGLIATGTLKLMSMSAAVKVCQESHQQLQLRVAVHSGSCSAGVVSLQTTVGTQRIPQYKLFGPVVNMTKKLCSSGLALQIRVSKPCWELLNKIGGYQFERCPDFMTWNGQKPIESYWLVGHDDYDCTLPTIDQAISLSEYEDNYYLV